MRAGAQRLPGAIPDDGDGADTAADQVGTTVAAGTDTDGDGRPDTLLTADGTDLLVLSDLDGDGLADRVLRIGPDGSVHTAYPGAPWHPGAPVDTGHDAGHDAGPVAGHAPAAPGPWGALLGRLLGLDP